MYVLLTKLFCVQLRVHYVVFVCPTLVVLEYYLCVVLEYYSSLLQTPTSESPKEVVSQKIDLWEYIFFPRLLSYIVGLAFASTSASLRVLFVATPTYNE